MFSACKRFWCPKMLIHITIITNNLINKFFCILFIILLLFKFKDRLNDTWVIVSDEEDLTPTNDVICNEIIDGEQDVVNVTCDYKNTTPPLRGCYVTIKRKDEASPRYWLNFCEVEVLSCHQGFWGKDIDNYTDCSQPCGHCIESTCRVSDGQWYSGCQEGFWGGKCDKRCHCLVCNRLTGCTSTFPRKSYLKNKILFLLKAMNQDLLN